MLLILSLGEVAESRGPKVVHNSVIRLQKFRFYFIRVQTLVCFRVLVSQGLKSSLFLGSSFLGSRVQFVLLTLGIAQKKTHKHNTHTHKQNHDVSSLAGKVNAYFNMDGHRGIRAQNFRTPVQTCRPKVQKPLLEKHAGS